MKRSFRFMVMGAVAVMAFVGCVKDKVEGVELNVGNEVPEFEVRMNDGRVVSDESLRGDVSVIMFFHTSCPDCQATLPVMQRIYDEYASKEVNFALISREEDEVSVSAFWMNKGLKMPYSAQKDRSMYEKFATSGIPRIYINDRNGIIRYIFTDNPVPEYDYIKQAIDILNK